MNKLYLNLLILILIISCVKGDYRMIKEINYFWIQKSDYSSDYYKTNSIKNTIDSFYSYNWQNELKKYDENKEHYNCPVGFGLHDGTENGSSFSKLLHICIIDENYIFFNLHYPKQKKLFGFIKYESYEIYYKDKYSIKNVNQLISLFYNSDYKEILNL